MIKKCPDCGSSRFKEGVCKKCGFLNDPDYLKKIQEVKNGTT